MTREELLNLIQGEIKSLAFDTLREKKEEVVEEPVAKETLSEEDIEDLIFFGGLNSDKPSKTASHVMIKENSENGIPQVTASEIAQFEDSFEEMLKDIDGASVVFDKQSNGYSLKISFLPQEGIEAGASGVINMGDRGELRWSFSLKNGLNVETQNLRVYSGNKRLLEKLFSFYDGWQKEWREKLTISATEEIEQTTNPEAIPGEEPPIESGEEAIPEV